MPPGDMLIFATNNNHKVREINSIAGSKYHIVSLREAGIVIDIPEPYPTLEENARTKCGTIYQLTGNDCFSEDTGLEVESLHGAPGVKSARYAGEAKDDRENMDLLLKNLTGSENRKAQFRTVIALMFGGVEYQFEGICRGSISAYPKGSEGFGYDPVFIPEGATRTFAEMDLAEKNVYSHRQKATSQLISFLSHNWKKTSHF